MGLFFSIVIDFLVISVLMFISFDRQNVENYADMYIHVTVRYSKIYLNKEER